MRAVINRIVLIFLGLFLISFNYEPCQAQESKLDSLQALLDNHLLKDTVRINLLNEIAEKSYSKNLDKALVFANDALELSNIYDYQKGKAKSLRLIGICYLVKGDYGNSLNNFKKSLSNYKAFNNLKGVADVLNNIGSLYYYRQDSLPLAIKFYNEAMGIYSAVNDSSGVVGVLTNIGNIYWVKGNYVKALDSYQQSLKYTEQMGLEDQVARNLGNIGLIYIRLGDYEKSKEYIERSIKINEKSGDNRGLMSNYRDVGGAYEKLGKDSLALKYYRKALDLCEEIGNVKQRAYTLVSVGTIYQKVGKLDLAMLTTKEALSIGRELDDRWIIGSACLNLASIYYDLGKYETALNYLLKGQKNAKERGQLNQQSDAYELLAKIYSQTKNYKKAYENHIQYKIVSDSIFNESNVKELTNLENQYDFDKEKKAIAIEQAKKDVIQREDMRRQKLLRNSFIIGFLIVCLSVIIIYYYYLRIKKNNVLLSEQNRIITKQKEEKEWLLKEIHHRVKNNLQVVSSLLDLQSNNIDDELAVSAITDGQSRVKAMALIHQKLYQNENVSQIYFTEYAKQLIDQIAGAIGLKKNIQYNVNGDDTFFDIDTGIPLGLILSELITNAYKYAFEGIENGKIEVSIIKMPTDSYQMIVQDNGKGLPEGFNANKAKSLGLRLVRRLSKQLYGKVEYSYDKGSKFTIDFKDTVARREIE